jgi:hypothetical protein
MTFQQCLDVWRELLDVTRLITAVDTVTKTERSEAVWRAGLVALEQRRAVLACVLSLEPQARLDAVYAQLVAEGRGSPVESLDGRVH